MRTIMHPMKSQRIIGKNEESMMRDIDVSEVTKAVKEMCISVNYELSDDMKECMRSSVDKEQSPLGKQILNQLQENLKIAREIGLERFLPFLEKQKSGN